MVVGRCCNDCVDMQRHIPTWLTFSTSCRVSFPMDLRLDDEVCCLSCYLSYFEKFLTLEEIQKARAISFDCRCDFGDLPPPARAPAQPAVQSESGSLGQDEKDEASPMEQ